MLSRPVEIAVAERESVVVPIENIDHRGSAAIETNKVVTIGMVCALAKMNRYWRAANYLCIGQIYLFDNPLLRSPLKAEQIKPRLLGHWGTSPGQNFIYIHLNRLIKEHDADIIYISGPGHGGPS